MQYITIKIVTPTLYVLVLTEDLQKSYLVYRLLLEILKSLSRSRKHL